MFNHRFFLFIAVTACFSLLSCAQKSSGRYTIGFYNTENFFDTKDNPDKDDDEFTPDGKNHYTERVYGQKLHNIARVIDQLGTDDDPYGAVFIGLAEVENKTVLSDLLAQPELSNRNYRYIIFDGPDPRGINTALLYDYKRFHLLHAQPLHVSIKDVEGNENATRDILFVSGVLGIDTVHVLVNHWPSRREGADESENKRMAVAQVDRRVADSLLNRNASSKIIVMGDLNDDPDDASVVNGLETVADKSAAVNGNLFNPWFNIYRSGSGTLLFSHHWDLFDQIIISSGLIKSSKGHLRFSKASIFERDFLITQYGRFRGYPHRSFAGSHWINGYSDHLPITLSFEKAP